MYNDNIRISVGVSGAGCTMTDNICISVGVSGTGCTMTTYVSVSVYQELGVQ